MMVGMGVLQMAEANTRWRLSSPIAMVVLGGMALLGAGYAIGTTLERDWPYLLAVLLAGGWLWLRRYRATASPPSPALGDRATMQQTLTRLQGDLERLQDAAVQQSLMQQVAALKTRLQEASVRVAVCGAVGVGKSAVVAALRGAIAALPAAECNPVASREVSFTLTSAGRSRRYVTLVDTPGLLGIGTAGAENDRAARCLARHADLVVFVLSGDLTASELAVLEELRQPGKRVLVAFNQSDRYLPRDRAAVLERLQQRLQDWVAPADIVAIAAQPAPVKVRQVLPDSGDVREWYEAVPPDIAPLRHRLETVLETEWADIACAGARTHVREIERTLHQSLMQQYRTAAAPAIARAQGMAAVAVFASPFPSLDLAAGAAIQAHLLVEIARAYNRSLSLRQAKDIATTLGQTLLQLGVAEAATLAVIGLMKTHAATYALGGLIQAVSAAYIVRVGGESFMALLECDPAPDLVQPDAIARLRALCRETVAQWQQGDRVLAFARQAIAALQQGDTTVTP